MNDQEISVYDAIGGEPTFKKLVWTFYEKVENDDKLRAIFPEDLEPGKNHQYLFLMQFFGGPTTYNSLRGHPRMRMRHMPYPINRDLRDRWLQYMLEAIDETGIEEPSRSIMRDYFIRGSEFLINSYDIQDE